METKKCLKCNYTWKGRIKQPKECPKCKSYKWNVKVCQWCNKVIKEGEEFNFLLNTYSHKKCDDRYFKEQ